MSVGEHSKRFFDAPAPRYFTIDPQEKFLLRLAEELRECVDEAACASIADTVIYLPTRRAVRALGDAILASAPDEVSLLPRIRALGDIDEDEFTVFAGDAADEIDLPPAISPLERRLALARLVAARDRAFSGQEHWAGALAAADELGKLLDSFYTEEVSVDRLGELAPEGLAAHWAKSLEFLEIVTKAWPAYLEQNCVMDPAQRRVALIDRQVDAWRARPPQHPVIVAGSTGSTPAVARMMACVAALPKGVVVFPGLDLDMAPAHWRVVDDPHPQSGLKHLLEERLGIDRAVVKPWLARSCAPRSLRSELISVALRPASASDSWRDWAREFAISKHSHSLQNFELVEAKNSEREADAISLRIREAIENPVSTVFLVTPDRNLARRVSLKLRRWGLVVDDSAGVPFANSPCGTFLRLVAAWMREPSNAVALMALMRHPLFGGGLAANERFKSVDTADLALRGLAPAGGVDALIAKAVASPKAAPVMVSIGEAAKRFPQTGATFEERFEAHLELAEHLAAAGDIFGEERLWRNEDGETGAEHLARLRALAAGVIHASADDYPQIFDQLIANIAVRRNTPAHPRIAILGPLEARLQKADIVILGGLNEGIWPRDAAIDPFLSRAMRRDIGLPSPERRIGLAAHDFAGLAAAPSVLMTRSSKSGGKPTTPSRWIVRLKNILAGAELLDGVDQTHRFEQLAAALDKTDYAPIDPPKPRPPVLSRPTTFYVTRVETLLRDPYSIYAQSILRLKKLDELNESVDARHVGNLFHKIFERFVCEESAVQDAPARLRALFEEHAEAYGIDAARRAFWRKRAYDALDWFASWDAERRDEGETVIAEGKGHWRFRLGEVDYELSAKADRIDLLKRGAATIFDYKTGTPPPTKKQQSAFSPQLPLTALIVQEGGFEALGKVPVEQFEYLRVLNRKNDGRDATGASGDECAMLMAEAREGLMQLLSYFQKPDTAYLSQPRSQFEKEYGDYDHLARRRERGAAGGDE